MKSKTAVLIGISIFMVACAGKSRGPVPDAPSMNARRYAKLKQVAGQDLGCDPEALVHAYEGENMHRMSGCGTDGLYELRCFMGSCVWIQDVRKRAEFDLACTKPNLMVAKIGPNSAGVAGCGKKATYLLNPANGEWVLNSAVEVAPVEAAPRKTNPTTDI